MSVFAAANKLTGGDEFNFVHLMFPYVRAEMLKGEGGICVKLAHCISVSAWHGDREPKRFAVNVNRKAVTCN